MQLGEAIKRYQPGLYHRIVYLLMGSLELHEILDLLRSEDVLIAKIREAVTIITGRAPPTASGPQALQQAMQKAKAVPKVAPTAGTPLGLSPLVPQRLRDRRHRSQ